MRKSLPLLLPLILLLAATGGRAQTAASLAENLKLTGAFRYRHETIDREGGVTRNRHRLRAQLGLGTRVTQSLTVGMQLASGTDDPISTNQTLGGGFSTKEIRLDLAFFDWQPPTGAARLQVSGGKIANPFLTVGKSELIWDHDLRPEGLAAGLGGKLGAVEAFASGGGFWVDEYSAAEDPFLWGLQSGLKIPLAASGTLLTIGGGWFDYTNTAGAPTFFDPEDSFGNDVVNGRYRDDFNELELFAELALRAGGLPVGLYFDYASNLAAADQGAGWLAGWSLGKCREPGSIAFRHHYRVLERNAVIAAFTDSDFLGGGTGGSGHELGLDLQAAPNVRPGVTYFYNHLEAGDLTYHRLQLDFSLSF